MSFKVPGAQGPGAQKGPENKPKGGSVMDALGGKASKAFQIAGMKDDVNKAGKNMPAAGSKSNPAKIGKAKEAPF
jgi:hypothetical protein